MKKLAGFVSALVLTTAFSTTCAAMQFQKPVFIGMIAGVYAGGPHPAHLWKISKEVVVKKDAMVMGKGKTALLFKYKDIGYANDKYKYRNITDLISGNGNSFPQEFPNSNEKFRSNHKVYQINGDNGIVAYVDIEFTGTGVTADELYIRGLWNEGKAVIFVNNNSFDQFKTDKYDGFFFNGERIRIQNDIICVPYTLNKGEFYDKVIRKGEFRFKWDDKAQWFGIEDVVY